MTVKRRTNYYTVTELAYVCGVSEECVRRWIRNGKLKATWVSDPYNKGRMGGAGWVIPIDELVDFDPIDNAMQMSQLKRSSDIHETRDYLNWLDRKTDQLYREIELVEKMKEYVREIGPYL